MGDLLFMIKTIVYTVFLVVFFQIKIGSTTIEQKVVQFTHESNIALRVQSSVQQFADHVVGKIKNKAYNLSPIQASKQPGSRLSNKYKEIKDSIREQWKEHDVKNAINLEELEEEYDEITSKR